MIKKILPKIEIEFRSIFNKNRYRKIESFLQKNAKDLGEDDKDVFFFIMPDKLLKVVNNISKNNADIVLKFNKIGKGSDFEELEIPIRQSDVEKVVRLFSDLNITNNVMHSFQKRHNYRYKNVNLALKHSNIWGYHLELEIMINDKNKKDWTEKQIKKVADELGLKLMTNKELLEFTRKKEKEYHQKIKIQNNAIC